MTSNERSFPWDDHNGDREYSSDEFAEFFSTLFKPGVVATANFGTGLQITESASLGMRVKFGSGQAFSSFGRNYVHDKDEEVTVPIASTLQDRTDSVAIQFNKSQREAFFVYKESDTTVTRTDSIFELQIAKILVPKNSTQITNANITDMRANESVCGYFSPHGKLNAGDITVQFMAWFEEFKGKLGTDPATNLQLQINDLDSRAVHNTGDENIAGEKTFTDTVSVKNLQVYGDTDWTNLTPINGFTTVTNTKLQYCIEKGVLYINVQGTQTPAINQATPIVMAQLPFQIKNTHNFAASVASSSGSGRYANSPAVIYVGTDGTISFNSYITINSGQRVWGSTSIPLFKV